MTDELDDDLYTDDIADAVDELSEDDLRERAQALDDAQTAWEQLSYLAVRKMPCPECTGAGAVSAGVLGELCPTCFGRRLIDHPDAEPFEMPDFRALREPITKYGKALANRQLPEGHYLRTDPNGKLPPEAFLLPPASSVPTVEQITQLKDQAAEKRKQIGDGADRPKPGELPAYQPPKGLAGDGDLGDFDDAELDAMEAEDLGDDT